MKDRMPISTFQIAATYIGTVVGAGFASGQEVLKFFIAFGLGGVWGIVAATLLFFFFGYAVLLLGNKLRAKSHLEVVRFTNGKGIGTVIDGIITVFLFGALAAMIAGAGAIVNEQFGLSSQWGTVGMAAITLATVLAGTKGVVNAISTVVPFLLFFVVLIALHSLLFNPITNEEIVLAQNLQGTAPNWLIAAINYASYNLVLAVAVLGPVGAKAGSKRKCYRGALWGALGLGVGISCIYIALLTNIVDTSGLEVPMIAIASNLSNGIKILYAVILFAEVYTTAVGNLYGLVRRLSGKESPSFRMAAGLIILAFGVSQFGFSNMIQYLYPAVGYGGLLFFAGILCVWVQKKNAIR